MLTTAQPLSGQAEEILREQTVAGNCVLFIGPEISRALLSRAELAQELVTFQGRDSLGDLSFPWLAQCHEFKYGRPSLISFLKEKIEGVKEPPSCYRAIAALPFRLILTTNYDTLLEKALDEKGAAYQKVLGDYELKHRMLGAVPIVKLYGCITEQDSMVITEEDRFAFFDRWPDILDILGRELSGKALLFIGCDLRDRDFRQLYHRLSPRLDKARSAYAIQPGLSAPLMHYWATRGLTVIEADATEFLRRATEDMEAREVEQTPFEPISEPLELEWAQKSVKGRFHTINEDSLEACMSFNLFLVADGVGGGSAGEVASQLAVNTIVEEYYHTDTEEDIPAGLTYPIEAANRAIYQQATENRAQWGMCTTVVAAVVRGRELYVANVGDSRAYLIRGDVIEQITLDHNALAETLREGRITLTLEQIRRHPDRNLLTRALGSDRQVEVDIFQRKLEQGDIIVLCSDGLASLRGFVRDGEIKEVVNRYPPASAVERLVKLANDRGELDDISIIVVRAGKGKRTVLQKAISRFGLK